MKNIKKVMAMFFCLAMMIFSVTTVSAATKWTYSHSVGIGGSKSYSNLSASNNYANIDMTIDGVSYGTRTTTVYKTYLGSGSSMTLKTTKSYSISKNTCIFKGLGYVGKGTWTITNNAFSSNANYAGWNGTLIIYSSTSSL